MHFDTLTTEYISNKSNDTNAFYELPTSTKVVLDTKSNFTFLDLYVLERKESYSSQTIYCVTTTSDDFLGTMFFGTTLASVQSVYAPARVTSSDIYTAVLPRPFQNYTLVAEQNPHSNQGFFFELHDVKEMKPLYSSSPYNCISFESNRDAFLTIPHENTTKSDTKVISQPIDRTAPCILTLRYQGPSTSTFTTPEESATHSLPDPHSSVDSLQGVSTVINLNVDAVNTGLSNSHITYICLSNPADMTNLESLQLTCPKLTFISELRHASEPFKVRFFNSQNRVATRTLTLDLRLNSAYPVSFFSLTIVTLLSAFFALM